MTSENKEQLQKIQSIEKLLVNQFGDVDPLLAENPLVKKLVAALNKSEAQNKAMLEGFQGMVFLFDVNLKVISANSRAGKIFSDPVSKQCHEIFRCGKETCINCVVTDTFKAKNFQNQTKMVSAQSKDGRELHIEIACSPVLSKSGVIDNAIVIARDVSEKLKMEKQLRHAYKMEAVGTLAGGIAHDFNNLLTPIMGYSEIIRMCMQAEQQGGGEVVEYVDEILTAAKRAKKLVEQILTFSRSGEQKESLQYLHPIVKEVMKFIQTTLPSTINVKKEIDVDCGMVSIDPVQIHQILINMCTNASNAIGGKPGELTVCLKKASFPNDNREWLELRVSDNGCGIEPHLRERIFEPYFTTREKEQGTGMGLAMLHGVVKRQGGKIILESEVGKGTTFHIFLPIASEATSPEQIVNPRNLIGGTERILLVDDEEQVVEVASRILESLGYRVTTKTSAREALLLFTNDYSGYDLVITDQTMPYLTGTELCKELKKIRPGIPVILFTGHFEDINGNDESADVRVDGVCMKPVSFKEMAETVRKVIDESLA